MGIRKPISAAESKPLDLSHHLSTEARERTPNPMKAIWKVAQSRPGAISLANGDPHFSLYPIRKMEFQVPSLDYEDPVHEWRFGTSAPGSLSASTDPETSVVPLQRALGYTTGAGLPETQKVLADFTRLFHSPPNHDITPTLGNFDAVTKCFRLLGERGDTFLADEFSFSALTNAGVAHGIQWVPAKIDAGGLVPSALEKMLREWNVKEQGRRPHVLYTTPCGQNPTGSTLSRERRQKIYEIAQMWDLVIIEDDPYFFLQYDLPSIDPSSPNFGAQYARGFVPSFLSLDVDGRVLRVDSFSKILAPGMRLGWITASPAFTERLVVLTDSSTMHPHGFGQLFVIEMLSRNGWGLDGFARWAHSLCADYKRRRDHFLKRFTELVPAECAFAEAPQAGMFFWIRVKVDDHHRFRRDENAKGAKTNTAELMDELFHKLLDDGVVMMPASIFAVEKGAHLSEMSDRLNFFRATFAGTEETVDQGLSVFAKSVQEFFTST